MNPTNVTIKPTLVALLLLVSIYISNGQNAIGVTTDNIHKFNTEISFLYDNALISDGTFLYDMKHDGGVNGGGYIFKIKPDGSQYSVVFNFESNGTGLNPVGTLALSGTTLYGMTILGGDNNMGIVFKIQTDGTGFQKLLDFNNTNGAMPYGSLTVSGSTLYGVSQQGGTHGYGLLFKIQTDGTGYQTLLNFNGPNGWGPTGSLTLSESTLYGMTTRGGANDLGVVFSIGINGTGYQKLVDFEQETGAIPNGSLTVSGTTLYGTTTQGGNTWTGTLFKVGKDGSNFQVIHFFGTDAGINPIGKPVIIGSKIFGMTVNGGWADGLIYSVDTTGNNFTTLHPFAKTDGENPLGSVTLVGDKLYGHVKGGSRDYGLIFKINQNGSEFEVLKEFSSTNQGYDPRGGLLMTPASGFGITRGGGEFNKGVIYRVANDGSTYEVLHHFNGDEGANPESTMTLLGNTLYGMTPFGGSAGIGTLFKVDTTGANFQVLQHFTGSNGSFPVGSLIDDGENTLYGMTGANASNNKGTVFAFAKNTNELTTLYSFEDTDAIRPYGAITLSNSKLYGMSLGGIGDGVIFSLNLDGSGFTKILDETSQEAGRYPNSLTVSGNTVYATMRQGGEADFGTLIKVQTDGTGFQKLVDFNIGTGETATGILPVGATIVHGDTIVYGMTEIGGPSGSGTIYSVRTDGTDFTILIDFNDVNPSSGGRVKSSGQPITAQGSLSYNDGFFYAPLSLQSGLRKTGGIIKFIRDVTDIVNGIEEEKIRLTVFPNPTASRIEFSGNKNIFQVDIVDSSGKKIISKTTTNNSIDVSHLPRGMYYLRIGSKQYRFVKN